MHVITVQLGHSFLRKMERMFTAIAMDPSIGHSWMNKSTAIQLQTPSREVIDVIGGEGGVRMQEVGLDEESMYRELLLTQLRLLNVHQWPRNSLAEVPDNSPSFHRN